MSRSELTERLKRALLENPELSERSAGVAREEIAGLDLTSEERHKARSEAGYALRELCEELCGLHYVEEATDNAREPSLARLLLEAALERVDFKAIADHYVEEAEGPRATEPAGRGHAPDAGRDRRARADRPTQGRPPISAPCLRSQRKEPVMNQIPRRARGC